MHVVEDEPYGIIADRLDLDNPDVLLAADRLPLGGRMALHFRARTHDAQIFRRELERLPAVERDGEHAAFVFQPYLRRPGIVRHTCQCPAPGRALRAVRTKSA